MQKASGSFQAKYSTKGFRQELGSKTRLGAILVRFCTRFVVLCLLSVCSRDGVKATEGGHLVGSSKPMVCTRQQHIDRQANGGAGERTVCWTP